MNDRSKAPSRVPVRGAIALALTLGGMALLFSFRTPGDAGADAVLALAPEPDATEELIPTALPTDLPPVAADPSPTRRPFAGATGPSDGGTQPSDGGTSTDDGSSTSADDGGSTTAQTSMDDGTPAAATVRLVGDPVAIRWGDVQVVITLAGDDIIDVETIDLPLGDRRSSSINQRAEPVLRRQAIAIDSADVDVVSGATYTSRAYAMSLQSALDQIG